MKKNSIEEDIILLKDFTEGNFKRDKLENYKGSYKMGYFYYKDIQQALEHILSNYKRVLKENEGLKKIHIQDNKRLDFIMKHSIPIQKIEKLIEELKQDDINMTRKYKEKNGITGELLGIDKVRVRAHREKTREIKEKIHKLLSD